MAAASIRSRFIYVLIFCTLTYIFLTLYIVNEASKTLDEVLEISNNLYINNITSAKTLNDATTPSNNLTTILLQIFSHQRHKNSDLYTVAFLQYLKNRLFHSKATTKLETKQPIGLPTANYLQSIKDLLTKTDIKENGLATKVPIYEIKENTPKTKAPHVLRIIDPEIDFQQFWEPTGKDDNIKDYGKLHDVMPAKQSLLVPSMHQVPFINEVKPSYVFQLLRSKIVFDEKYVSSNHLAQTKAGVQFSKSKEQSKSQRPQVSLSQYNYSIKVVTQISKKHYSIAPNQLFNSQNASKLETKGKDKRLRTVKATTGPTKNPALIIDTPGCKIPKMDPWDPSIIKLIELHPPYVCSDRPPFLTPEPNGIVHLNVSVLEKYYNSTPKDLKCWYQGILRKYAEPGTLRENGYNTSGVYPLEFETPIDYDYVGVKCFFNNNTHEQYFPLPRIKKEVEKERSKVKPENPLSVILLGIDSVSKLNFLRHFRRTKAFMSANMDTFDMKGYAKVGDNTFPNLVPMLTGHFAEYFWNETVRDTFAFDNVSFIWKDYARNGYRTFFAEDAPYAGTFNYIKRGFLEQPTDYYYRPLALVIEQSELRKKNRLNRSPCLDHQLETELMFDYVKNFAKTMDKRPYFAFCMVSVLTHDFFNAAGYVDVPALRLLEALQESGALNNTALIMFSDHGLRFGDIRNTYIGKLEERMPFMYIHIPKWFLQLNPGIKKNLAINQNRLITLFDIHATLKHLLHLNKSSLEKTDELGLSLFHEIPANRTCVEANIKQHWCPCNNFKPVSVNNPFVIAVSQSIVGYLNGLLLHHADKCEKLELAEIKDAQLGHSNDLALKFERDGNAVRNQTVVLGEAPSIISDYLITFKTKPGGAMIEGTVRYDEGRSVAKVIGVSRINKYGRQSWCIESESLKLYCYCKTQNNTGLLLFDYDFSNR